MKKSENKLTILQKKTIKFKNTTEEREIFIDPYLSINERNIQNVYAYPETNDIAVNAAYKTTEAYIYSTR